MADEIAIKLHPTEPRKHRLLRFRANNLLAMAISDMNAEKATVSLELASGSMDGPRAIPGLAHFAEHMIFRKEKNSTTDSFDEFVAKNGGFLNAVTSVDRTLFYYEVAMNGLAESLERFASLFIEPKCDESTIANELSALDSENTNNLSEDAWRSQQLERSLSNPNHRYNHFSTGSHDTLISGAGGLDKIRTALREFISERYSANIMTVVVLGNRPIDELADLIVRTLSLIPNRDAARTEFEHPFGAEQLRKRVMIVPLKDIRALVCGFPLPDMSEEYRSKPWTYVCEILRDERTGGLSHYLRTKHWTTSLDASIGRPSRGFWFLIVKVHLTRLGLQIIDQIVESIFEFIQTIKAAGAEEWRFVELQTLNNLRMRFRPIAVGLEYTSSLAHDLQVYKNKADAVIATDMMDEYRPDLIAAILDRVVPSNMLLTIVSKSFNNVADQTEKFYGTRYRIETIAPTTISKWERAKAADRYRLPGKNDYIPTNFDLVSPETPSANSNNSNGNLRPELIRSDEFVHVWFDQPRPMKKPKAQVYLRFRNPLTYSTASNFALAYIWTSAVEEWMEIDSYDSRLAGYYFSLLRDEYGIVLKVSGYSEKLRLLTSKIVEQLSTPSVTSEQFEIIREHFVRGVKNLSAQQPYAMANYFTTMLLSERHLSRADLITAAAGSTLSMMNNFVNDFWRTFFIETFFYGNVSKEATLAMIEEVYEIVGRNRKVSPLAATQFNRIRELCLPEGSSYLFEMATDTHENSATAILLQLGVAEPCLIAISELLVRIIGQWFNDDLRIKHAMGYHTNCSIRVHHGVRTLQLIVQGDRNPDDVEANVERCLQETKNRLISMGDDDFSTTKNLLKSEYEGSPITGIAFAAACWDQIVKETYNFDEGRAVGRALAQLTKEDFVQFYEERISPDSKRRKKLCIRVRGRKCRDSVSEGVETLEKPHLLAEPITNFQRFQSSLSVYPLPAPSMDVPKGNLLRTSFLFEMSTNIHENSATAILLQLGVEEPYLVAISELLVRIIGQWFNDDLRIKHAMGYHTNCSIRVHHGVRTLQLIVQGDRNPDDVEAKVERFLQETKDRLISMDDGDFSTTKNLLMTEYEGSPTTGIAYAAACWDQIVKETYNFVEGRAILRALEQITKEDFVQFYERQISPSSTSRKKLCVRVQGKKRQAATGDTNTGAKSVQQAVPITNVQRFQSRLSVYPLPAPSVDVPKGNLLSKYL